MDEILPYPRTRERTRRLRQKARIETFGSVRQFRADREESIRRVIWWVQGAPSVDFSDLAFLTRKPGRVCDFAYVLSS